MFVPGKPLQPSRMFACKAGAYPSEAPFEMLNKIYHNMFETAYLGKNALPKIAQ